MGCTWMCERRVKDYSKVFGLTNWEHRTIFYSYKKEFEEAIFCVWEIRGSTWNMSLRCSLDS